MQVDTSVDEADIGRIQVDQRVTFTVDAFPGREFTGQVLQIRKEPKTVQNVVTYTVVVSAENPDLVLLPGMTANVQMVVGERPEALKVPNGALRFNPVGEDTSKKSPSGEGKPEGEVESGPQGRAALFERLAGFLELTEDQKSRIREIFAQGRKKVMAMREGGATLEEIREEIKRMQQKSRQAIMSILTPEQRKKFRLIQARRARNPIQPGRVWVIGPKGAPAAVDVMIGITDGNFTEIVRGELEAGQDVIIGAGQPGSASKSGVMRRLGF
jgi:HlyD family secretion protein